jgi:hypothetical protein
MVVDFPVKILLRLDVSSALVEEAEGFIRRKACASVTGPDRIDYT